MVRLCPPPQAHFMRLGMSIDRREHRMRLHHHIWQDGRHLAHHAWPTLRQRMRTDTVVADGPARPWRHPPLGYLVAVLGQIAAVSPTGYPRHLGWHGFPYC